MADTTNINHPSDVKAAIDSGILQADAESRITDLDGIPIAIVPSNMQVQLLLSVLEAQDNRATAPRRLRGTSRQTEIESFIAHVNRFKDANSAIFADAEKAALTAVLNYHRTADGPRWSDHRSVYTCPLSASWKAWASQNDKPMPQDEFATWLDDHRRDLANLNDIEAGEYPAPASVLQLARNLTIRTKGEFSRAINETTGEAALVNKVEHDATSTKIPRAFLLALQVFEAGTIYRVEARVRFQLGGGKPSFCYSLYEPQEVLREAFGAVRLQAQSGTSLPVFAGAPEA